MALQGTREISHVIDSTGTRVPLSELPCLRCGALGCSHIALHHSGAYGFCSWEHLTELMRINGQPVNEALMVEAGLKVIGPRPEA